jgi:uncharacterized protein (TIGR03083 family)
MARKIPGPVNGTVRDALASAGAQFTQMLRRVTDPSRPAIGNWNIGETAAHAASSPPFFLAVARGATEPGALAEVAVNNATFLAADHERNPAVLAERYSAGERALLAHVDGVGGDSVVEAFRGVEVPLSTLLAVELGEVLVHGYDIARAAGLRWPMGRAQAALAAGGMLPLLPHLVDREAAAGRRISYELRIRGGVRAVLAFEAGVLHLSSPGRRPVDCLLSVDPVVYLLLSFARMGPLRPMLQGKLWAWGRRPWLAASFTGLFQKV